MKRTLVISAVVTACSSPDVTIDAPSLIGKSRSEVDAVMGKAECHAETPGTVCEYGGYKTVYFVNGRAANLTLPRADDLRTYGLDLGEPILEKPGFEQWETQINGQRTTVSRFDDYVHIMTFDTYSRNSA